MVTRIIEFVTEKSLPVIPCWVASEMISSTRKSKTVTWASERLPISRISTSRNP